MSRMTESQRLQFDRPDLRGPDRSVRMATNRPLYIFMAIAVVIAGLLGWQAIERIDGWASWVVLGAIVATTIGMIIAVSPTRRA
jgi:threonine/homoserine efflux transporter RhtA